MDEKKRKKILFCFFNPKGNDYVPLDVGFVITLLQRECPNKYDCEIVQLGYEVLEEDQLGSRQQVHDESVKRDVALIEYHRPDAVFIFAENVLWSKVFAFGRAMHIIWALREKNVRFFIGLQSYKVMSRHCKIAFRDNAVQCVINGDIEHVFVRLGRILQKKPVDGVVYDVNAFDEKNDACVVEKEHEVRDLDLIPSPYLEHVFDNYLHMLQAKKKGCFRAFLVSSRGCNFKCYYCFRSVKFERVRYFSAKRFYDEMEYLYTHFAIRRFFVLDDAFLYAKSRLREFAVEFQQRCNKNPGMRTVSVFIMARPETIDEEVIELLSQIRVDFIQIGLQTVNPALQGYMRRTIDTVYFKDIREWMRKYDMKLHLDIVIGLPGDTAEWMMETLRYALTLDPYALQLKQFFLNPNTLFYNERERYGIEMEDKIRDFDTPYVVRAQNVDDVYYERTNDFIMNQINAHPEVYWKYITQRKVFRSHKYH